MLWWRGVVPEGDTRIQAGVQRSETPERRPPHQYLNPEGVTELHHEKICHPIGVLLSVLISTGVAPLPMSMYRGCTPACVLSPFQGYWGYTTVGASMFQSLLDQLIYSSNANRSSNCIPYASRNILYSSRKVRFL